MHFTILASPTVQSGLRRRTISTIVVLQPVVLSSANGCSHVLFQIWYIKKETRFAKYSTKRRFDGPLLLHDISTLRHIERSDRCQRLVDRIQVLIDLEPYGVCKNQGCGDVVLVVRRKFKDRPLRLRASAVAMRFVWRRSLSARSCCVLSHA